MARGRTPKPAALRKASGNAGKRPIAPEAPRAEGIPEPPEHLSDLARVEWDRVIGVMASMGTIGLDNLTVLAVYCQNWGRMIEAERHVNRHGPIVKAPRTGVPMYNPYLSVANGAAAMVAKLAAELGLTPASRQRVGAVGSKKTGSRFARNGVQQRSA